MALVTPDPIYPSKEARKIFLARLEGEVLDWAAEHGDTFPALRDLCHEIEMQIDKERETL